MCRMYECFNFLEDGHFLLLFFLLTINKEH